MLGDALVYADHAGRHGSVQMDDLTLAVQSRVGWEFGGRVPKEVIVITKHHPISSSSSSSSSSYQHH